MLSVTSVYTESTASRETNSNTHHTYNVNMHVHIGKRSMNRHKKSVTVHYIEKRRSQLSSNS